MAFNSKNAKAMQIENMSNEIVKKDNSIMILIKLFLKIFNKDLLLIVVTHFSSLNVE